MSNRIQTAFPKDKPLPSNIFPDLNWVADNRLELYKQHGDCIVIVYKQEIIGIGKTRSEALSEAESHLAPEVELITPVIGFVSNPYRIGLLQRKIKQH